MSRAATTRLEPGEHSIDRAQVFPYRDGFAIRWSIRLNSGRLMRPLTQGPTKGKVRARARARAADLLSSSSDGKWKGTSDTLDYLDKVTRPAIRAERLADTTTRRYELAYRLLRGECGDEGCKHTHSLAGLSLREAMRPRALISCLEEIGRLHGAVNAKHAKTVAKKYLAAPLRVDEVIEYNPLIELDLDLSGARKPAYSRGGRALTAVQYRAAIEYLLAADPEDLEGIGRLNGAVNAKQAKTVAKKYLAAPLGVDEVIEYNPLIELDLDLSGARKPAYSRGGRALTAEQYRAAIEYLLAADPEDVE